MRALQARFFFFFFLSVSIVGGVNLNRFTSELHRRILHQPLFPETSTPPPPDFESTPSPPITPDTPDQPFFPENPSTPEQTQYPPPPPPVPADVNGGLPIPTATTQSAKPGKKVAIVISVGIVTLGMLSALAFFLYRHKAKHASDTQKLVSGGGDGGGGSRRFQEDPGPPTTTSSTFLYMGTVEPSRDSASESNGGTNGPVNTSPYRKLNSVKRSERYRPSPELQPLPPLAKPPQPSDNSPSALSPSSSSSGEECRDTAFYTPHGSTISSDDGYYTAFPRSVNSNGGSLPHSKRTSPRSKFGSAPATATSRSPEMKHVIIPSIKQKLPSPVQPLPRRSLESDKQEFPYSQNKPKFSQPPPPPNRAAFQAITQDNSPLSSRVPPPRRSPPPLQAPPPPPPPPPAPPRFTPPPPPQKRPRDFPILRKLTNSEAATTSPSRKQAFKTPSPNSKAVEEVNIKSASSLEKTGDGDTDPSKPKLKPLHWDKVRASSDRATVWDQLKSSSFQWVSLFTTLFCHIHLNLD